MEELKKIAEELRTCLTDKVNELSKAGGISTNMQSLIENRRRDIQEFENFINDVTRNPAHKLEIITNFEKEAGKIKAVINEIT